MALDYVDFDKQKAQRQQAINEAEQGKITTQKDQFEFEAEKKAYANKQASMKDISGLLKGYAEEDANAPKTPAQKTDAGPGGYDPSTGTTGEDRQQDANFKDQMAAQQMQGQSIQKQAQRLNQMMLAAAKNNDPETALKFRAELDGLDDKFRKNQTDTLTLVGKQYEVGGQLANDYLANQTPENWYNTTREAMRLGIPGSEAMLQTPLNKRADFAKAYKDRALTAQQELTGQLKIAQMQEKSREFYDGLEVKRMIADNSSRSAALSREIRQDQLELSKDSHNLAKVNAMLGKVTPRLSQAREDYNEADREYKEAAARKRDIQSGIIIIKDKEAKQKELDSLDIDMAESTKARDAAKANRENLTKQYEDLSVLNFPELADKKEEKPSATTKADPGESKAVNPEVASRFKAEPSLKNNKLGKRVLSGQYMGQYEVLDAKGKVVGYYK